MEQGKSSNGSASWYMAVGDTHTHTHTHTHTPWLRHLSPTYCASLLCHSLSGRRSVGVHLLTHASGSECVSLVVCGKLDSVFHLSLFSMMQAAADLPIVGVFRVFPLWNPKKLRASAYRLCQHVSVCRTNLCFLKGFKGPQEVFCLFLSGLDPGLRCLMTHRNGLSLPFTSPPSIFLLPSADFLSPFLRISLSFPLPAPFNLYNKA